MGKLALAVLIASVAGPAAAQMRAAEDAISFQAKAAQRGAANASARTRAVESTLVAMNDGVEAGGRVVAFLNDKKISVYTMTQSEAVKSGWVNGQPAITLSDSLPAHPRVYGPLIALETARLMDAGTPACAERSYMRSATAARVFAELGGEFKKLPAVDGDQAPAVKDAVAAWSMDAQSALEYLGKRDGVPGLPELEDAAKDQKTSDELQAADKKFLAFLLDEREARAAAR